jgi:hypothetical protein
MRHLVVKMGLRGDVYVDGRAVTWEELAGAIRQLNVDDGAVTYYRESPETEGSAPASDAFQHLLELRPNKIRMGDQAPSEWGGLQWIEVEEAPDVSRIFLASGEKYLISFPRMPGRPPTPVFVGGPFAAEVEQHWMRQFDMIISSDRIIDTPVHRPELCFSEAGLRDASLHIRISYGPDRRWASRYLVSEVPGQVASFHADVMRIARRMTSGTGRELPADEARGFFES